MSSKVEAGVSDRPSSKHPADELDPLAGDDEQDAFRLELVAAGVLTPTPLLGSYIHSENFEQVITGVARLVSARAGELDQPTVVRVPPVMARSRLIETSYLTSFPDLMGSVHSFRGTPREHAALVAAATAGQDWSSGLAPTDAVLCPAACHQVYALAQGVVPAAGLRWELLGQCFRAEPSRDPARMQAFRMQEQVVVGRPEQALAHRDRWLAIAADLLEGLGLTVEVVPAHDPFFGRLSGALAAGQLAKDLKFEVVARTSSATHRTALASANAHEDHFGRVFGLRLEDGTTAHSACVGFGLERIALALFARHGMRASDWPADLRTALAMRA